MAKSKLTIASMSMPDFVQARNTQEKSLKKAPTPEQHMQFAREHTYAADNSLSANDHAAASDHLAKASLHTAKAAEFYKKHSSCYIDKAMKGK